MLQKHYMEHRLVEMYSGICRQHGPARGPDQFGKVFQEAITKGELGIGDFSIRRLAEVCLGNQWQRIDPRYVQDAEMLIAEAGSDEGVDVTAFSNITGQIVFSAFLTYYDDPMFIGDQLMPTEQTPFDGEKEPGVGKIGDDGEDIHPGMPYPHVGLTEDFIETPSTKKRGLIIPVTREAIFFDRTAMIQRRAGEVGEALRWRKEKDQLRVVTGITNNFNWLEQAFNTYIEATNGGWTAVREGNGAVNALADITLEDWTDVEQLKLLFSALKDPNTGEPIVISPRILLVPDALSWTADRILTATEIRSTAGTQETLSRNVLEGSGVRRLSSPLLKQLLTTEKLDGTITVTAPQADKTWWCGDPNKSFVYKQNWPRQVTQAPSNSEAEFTKDIVLRFKATERGVAAVRDPRFMTRSRSTA